MRITHSMVSQNINKNLQNNLKKLEFYGHQMSTGKKFTKPSHNPVGVGRVMGYSASIDRNEQFRLNMNQSRGWLDNTEGSLRNGLDVMQRIRELAIYGANDSLTAEDRRAIAPEVLEFIDHLVGVANTESNGLYHFGGNQTLKAPYIRENTYNIVVHEDSGILNDEDHQVIAEGMQNGDYQLEQTSIESAEDLDARIEASQQYLQGAAQSIFGKDTNADVDPDPDSEFSSSVFLEVTGVDADSGVVEYRYSSHQYDLNGDYENKEGTFELVYGGDEEQTVFIGDFGVDISGLDELDPSDVSNLTVGDRAIYNKEPSRTDGETYDQITLSGEHRGGNSENIYVFSEGVLNDQEVELHYHSLDTFERSPEKGAVYDGKLSLHYGTFEDQDDQPASTFSYDSAGFPVYYGDDKDRIQEISPHQQVIMNLSGKKAFGENEQIFDAVFEVYNALMDDDREALGDKALEKMDASVNHLLEQLAQVGARSNRVEAMYDTLHSENLFLREVRSEIEDIDLAEVITDFTMQENAYRAALATAQRMLQPTLVDYMG